MLLISSTVLFGHFFFHSFNGKNKYHTTISLLSTHFSQWDLVAFAKRIVLSRMSLCTANISDEIWLNCFILSTLLMFLICVRFCLLWLEFFAPNQCFACLCMQTRKTIFVSGSFPLDSNEPTEVICTTTNGPLYLWCSFQFPRKSMICRKPNVYCSKTDEGYRHVIHIRSMLQCCTICVGLVQTNQTNVNDRSKAKFNSAHFMFVCCQSA